MASKRRAGIRAYVIRWAVSVFVALLVVTGGWLTGKYNLMRMQERVLTDAQALDSGRRLELAILGERRESLLWRATRAQDHKELAEKHMQLALGLLPVLQEHATSSEERAIVDEIVARIDAFRLYHAEQGRPDTDARASLADDLLAAVDKFQTQNKAQMVETTRAARRLQTRMTWWLAALLTIVALSLVAGAFGIVHRVIRPIFKLTRAAEEFGQGKFDARTEPEADDELGRLARTFNNMAEDIAKREESRLQFVATVAHDLRTPIAGIGLAVRLLRRCCRTRSVGPRPRESAEGKEGKAGDTAAKYRRCRPTKPSALAAGQSQDGVVQ